MKTRTISAADKDRSLLYYLRQAGCNIAADCGGRGVCGKCRVRFVQEAPEPKGIERAFLSVEELAEGWRLACLTHVQGSFEIAWEEAPEEREPAENVTGERGQYTLAIDLGTTTIAASLVDVRKKEIRKMVTGQNHQRSFGADVLSRIHAANQGEGKKLQETVLQDISSLCEKLGIENVLRQEKVGILISGNTCMQHLLQGLSCRGLGAYPYTPVDLTMHSFGNMTILPGIGAYVGADIVSGIIACGIDQREELSILVDLGTNGEIAIGNRDRILVTSAAAGPAFEGGNISCGMAGLPGAVDSVRIRKGQAQVMTIGGEKPSGICGSGVVDLVYELVREGLVDETGLLCDTYFETGYPLAEGIVFTAKDIRELQMAKAAIRTGIEIALDAFGARWDQIEHLYLAGGFGQKINIGKAIGIGLLPEEMEDRIIPVGNSSLKGAVMLAMEPELKGRFMHIPEISEEIVLADQDGFQDRYLSHMNLDLAGERCPAGKDGSTDWQCPSLEEAHGIPCPDKDLLEAMSRKENLIRLMEERAAGAGEKRYILPVWQNIEAAAISRKILGHGNGCSPSDYCIRALDDLKEKDLEFVGEGLIQAVIQVIEEYRDKDLILEVQAPFSVLAGLMNPIDLYGTEDGELLEAVLGRIAEASAAYITACLEAGCPAISLADPAGTMDLVGKEYYRRYCGKAALDLLDLCRPYLKQPALHICPKMAQSLWLSGLADVREYADCIHKRQ